jgi:hypothetical protein
VNPPLGSNNTLRAAEAVDQGAMPSLLQWYMAPLTGILLHLEDQGLLVVHLGIGKQRVLPR